MMGTPGSGFSLPPTLHIDLYKQAYGMTSGSKHSVQPAKKGAPWSDEEHKAFLNGLKMYGRGQWKQISRYYVPSRTPTQVASHGQKHFLRQSSVQKRRSRFSTVEEAAIAPAPPTRVVLQHGVALPPPDVSVPGLFGHALAPPVAVATSGTSAMQPPFHLPPQQRQQQQVPTGSTLAAPGSIQGGIAMGMPIGVLPPLPCITTATGIELPILPVMPGRINALTASAALFAPPGAAISCYSTDSSGSDLPTSKPPSPVPSGPACQPAAAAASTAGSCGTSRYSAQYAPNGRSQQLLRLLALNEQLTADRAISGSTVAATHLQPSGVSQSVPAQQAQQQQAQQHQAQQHQAQQHQAQQQQTSIWRLQSATAALDTLASLAEAEAQSDEEARMQSEEPGGTKPGAAARVPSAVQQLSVPAPLAAQAAQAHLVSVF